MPDGDTPTADDIEDAVAADVADGVQSFSDGTNQVTAMDAEQRLNVASRLRGNTAAQNPAFGLRFTSLKGGGAW